MTNHANHFRTSQVDPAFVARIVKQVIARLKAANEQRTTSQTNATAVSIDSEVVVADTIQQIPGTPAQIFVSSTAVVTPAARDEARQRNITINRSVNVPPEQQPQPNSRQSAKEIVDRQHPERAAAVVAQLARRGVTSIGSQTIVLTDSPAMEVQEQISGRSVRAVMVTTLSDVQRFESELRPEVWVLDMKRLNLIAAVNVAARIAQLRNQA